MMKQYIFLAAAAMLMSACNTDKENLDNGPVEAIITAGVDGATSRANNNLWEEDEIGVMVIAPSGNSMMELYKNVKYTTSANGKTEAIFKAYTQGIFFQSADDITFAAYGPYRESDANVLPGGDGVILDSTKYQNSRDVQKKVDYIYAFGATASRGNQTVEFKDDNKFNHKMSRLIISVKTSSDDGFTAEDVAAGVYTLGGLNHYGQFDVTTGTAEAIGETIDDAWSLTDNSLKTENNGVVTFTSILYPQTLQNALKFTATIDDLSYTNDSGIHPALEAGKSYSYTITVRKTGISISGCTIGNWTEIPNVDVDANI